MKNDPTFWFLARASGLTAYVMLTLSILAGLVLKTRPFRSLKAPVAMDIHRVLAILGLGAVAVHGVTLVLDTTVKVTPLGLLIPGLVSYRPVWTALGVVAAELMLVVYASFSLRKRIGMKNWRRLHWATYAIFAVATTHGLAAGTDSPRPFAMALYASAVAAVVTATTWRALSRPESPPRRGGTGRVPARTSPAADA
jgi:sulfoxide reductase heme-binding subunit YedZ